MDPCNILRLKSGSIHFLISMIVGWFISDKILNFGKDDHVSVQSIYLSNSSFCDPCRFNICPMCENHGQIYENTNNLNVENSYFRSYPYKAQNVAEDILSRWRFVTKKHMFENINGEPRVGLNGMWRQESESVQKLIPGLISAPTGKVVCKSIHRKTDPFYGTIYNAQIEKSNEVSGWAAKVLQVRRSFQGNKPKLISISSVAEREMITVISPVMKVSRRFHDFLYRFEQDILMKSKSTERSGQIKLLFVIFQTSSEDESSKQVLDVLESFKRKNPSAMVEKIVTIGKFSRALGLHLGVEKCKDDDLMLFLDVDLVVTNDFFDRIRRNTIRHKSVYFPVTFSQYDPNIIDKASQVYSMSKEISQNKMAVNESTGYWIHYAFGITSMYKSDYLKVGGFKLDIEGWGGEDVDLYKKFLADPVIEVFAAVDRDLIHIYHSRNCDFNLPHDQYRMCVGAWAETLGSQAEVSSLYLFKTL